MKDENVIDVNSYLSFKLGNEEFASHVSKVLNILEMTRITEIPQAPYYMKGVINLRGMVLPVIDTRLKFGMPETIYTEKTCIVVMELQLDKDEEKVFVGALVDEVMAVLELEKDQIQDPPSIGSKYESEFIYGMAKHDDNFIMLLDMEKAFSNEELIDLRAKTEEKELTK